MALHFFSTLTGALRRRLDESAREADPIDHPAIAAMSLAELADLPLGPDRYAPPPACCAVEPTAAARTEAPISTK